MDKAASLALVTAKQELRSHMKQRLLAIPVEAISIQSRRAFDALCTFPPYQNARSLSVFLSMPGGEIQTDAVVRDALAQGKHVFVPFLHRSPLAPAADQPVRVMDMVRLRDERDYEGLRPDRWGIPSVDPATVHERQRVLDGGPDAHHSDRATLDLVVMPGVAFGLDPATDLLRRLGHGKGFYDYFIKRYADKVAHQYGPDSSASSSLFLCGLALSEQFLADAEEQVPVGPRDQSLHGLILGSGHIITASQSRSE